MKIDGPLTTLPVPQATVTDTKRYLSLPEMFPTIAENRPLKTVDHKIIFLKEPIGGETTQVDRRERGGLRHRLGQICGAEIRSYTGQAIHICIDREQFEDAYERLAPKLFDTQSPITRFKVINALAKDSYESLGGDAWIALCIQQDNNVEEILSYLVELGATLNEAEIRIGKKPESDESLSNFGGYFSYFKGDLTSILRGFDFHCQTRSIMNLNDTGSISASISPLSVSDTDATNTPTNWRYSSHN